MTSHELARLLLALPDVSVGVSVEEGPDHTDIIEVSQNDRGVWICVLPECLEVQESSEPRSMINRAQFLEAAEKAITEFRDSIGAELEDDGVVYTDDWNDEFMLALYEYTKDPRKA